MRISLSLKLPDKTTSHTALCKSVIQNRNCVSSCCTGIFRIFIILTSILSISSPVWPASKAVYKSKPVFSTDAGILLCTDSGSVLYSQNAHRGFIPASTLKVLTSLCARHYLGSDYRFPTYFFLGKERNSPGVSSRSVSSGISLIIKGYGDPLFTSAIIHDACHKVAETLKSINIKTLNDVVVDNTFFAPNIRIDGKSDTNNPYDAYPGALSANFNTVSFRYSKTAHEYLSLDPEIPLFPLVMECIKLSGLNEGRISLPEEESRIYAGVLIRYFLSEEGISITGKVRTGTATRSDRPLYKFISPYKMDEITQRLLEYSSNFMANQIFLSAGAKAFSSPATVEKGVAAMTEYAGKMAGIHLPERSGSKRLPYGKKDSIRSIPADPDIFFTEGSGLSRQNRISAANMLKVLRKFRPYYNLMKNEKMHDDTGISYLNGNMVSASGIEYYKTGTLNRVRTRCGYLETSKRLYPFVIMLNENSNGYDRIRQFLWATVSAYEKNN